MGFLYIACMDQAPAQPETAEQVATVDQFQNDMTQVIGLASDAYCRIIEEKCPGSKAVSAVCSAFGIHRKLAWQVIKVAYCDDPFVAAKHMPSKKSTDVWVHAVEASGIDTQLVDAVRRAEVRFQELISTHASSKSEFDILVESSAQNEDTSTEERWRQQAFEGNSFTWGVHCRVMMGVCVLMPSDDKEDYFHLAQIRGLMGYRQSRPGVRWLLNQSVAVDDHVAHEQSMERVALDPEAALAHNGVPVLPEFCSSPMPAFTRTKTPDGMMQDEFLSSEIGLQGQRTLVTGELLRNIAPTHATPNDKTAHFGTGVRIPAEMLNFDIYVRAGLFGEVERELRVFSDVASKLTFQDIDVLSVSDKIVNLGLGLKRAHAPDLPGHQSFTQAIFHRLELDPNEYELYRIRMAFPPMPSTVMMKHELLPKDEGRS
tara:strand:- start:16734 stop:18020 length:1287 start_codon:yes stop_codon:yes gene_type:complete